MARQSTTSVDEMTDEQKKGVARTKAQATLRAAHSDEYQGYLAAEYAAVGLTYTRKETPEEKAAKQVADLLAQFPSLRGQVGVGEGAVPTAFPDDAEGGAR